MRGYDGNAFIDALAQGATARVAGSLDLLETDLLVVMVLVDGLAQELVVVEHADLSDIARVVADHHRPSDVAGQRRGDVAQPLEADAITAHHPGLGDREQQPVEVFQALGHARQPALGDPRGGLAIATGGVVVTVIGFQSSFGVLILGLLLTGAGIGAALAVASTAIIGNVPVRRAGMAASIEEVSYEFGSLIAVSVLGSLLTAIYSARVVLPDGAPDAAGNSIAEAQAAAQGDAEILQAAATAFDSAYLVVMLVVAVVLAVGAVITGVLLRRYLPGTQSQLHSEH